MKKREMALTGFVIMIALIVIVSPVNFAKESPKKEKEESYRDLIFEVNESLDDVNRNNENLKNIEDEVKEYQKEMREVLQSYEVLRDRIRKNLDRADRISDKINKSFDETIRVEEDLEGIKASLIENEDEFLEKRFEGLKFFQVIILGILNIFIWIMVSNSDRRKKYFR